MDRRPVSSILLASASVLVAACGSSLPSVPLPEAIVQSSAGYRFEGVAKDDVWLLGNPTMHYDGATFTAVTLPNAPIYVATGKGELLALGEYPSVKRVHADGTSEDVGGYPARQGARFQAAFARDGVVVIAEPSNDGDAFVRFRNGAFERLPAPPTPAEEDIHSTARSLVAVLPGGGVWAHLDVYAGPMGAPRNSTWDVIYSGSSWSSPIKAVTPTQSAFVVDGVLYASQQGPNVGKDAHAVFGGTGTTATKISGSTLQALSIAAPQDAIDAEMPFRGLGLAPGARGGLGVVGWDAYDGSSQRCDMVYHPLEGDTLGSESTIVDMGDNCLWLRTGFPPVQALNLLQDGTLVFRLDANLYVGKP